MGNGAGTNSGKPQTPNSLMRINSVQNLDISHNEQLVDQLRQGTPPFTTGIGAKSFQRGTREDITGAGPKTGAIGNNIGSQPVSIRIPTDQPKFRHTMNLSEVVPEEPDSENFGDFSRIGNGRDQTMGINHLNMSRMDPRFTKDFSLTSNQTGIPRNARLRADAEDEQVRKSARKRTAVLNQTRAPCQYPWQIVSSENYMDSAQTQRLKKKFDNLDRAHKGSITLEEFGNLREIHSHTFRERMIELLEDKLAEDKKSRLNFDQFLHALSIFHPKCPMEVKYTYVFRMYDINGDDQVDVADFAEMLKKIFSSKEMGEQDRMGLDTVFANEAYVEEMADRIITAHDPNGTKTLDFEQFRALFLEGDFETKMIINF